MELKINLRSKSNSALLKSAVNRFRDGCGENFWTTWLPRRKLLSKRVRSSSPEFAWTVTLPEHRSMTVQPDAVIGFDVKGSSRRVIFLSIDDGSLPVHSKTGDSIHLRTRGLLAARDLHDSNSPGELFGYVGIIVMWIMQNDRRVEELKCLLESEREPGIALIDASTFFEIDNVLYIKWEMPGRERQTII